MEDLVGSTGIYNAIRKGDEVKAPTCSKLKAKADYESYQPQVSSSGASKERWTRESKFQPVTSKDQLKLREPLPPQLHRMQ